MVSSPRNTVSAVIEFVGGGISRYSSQAVRTARVSISMNGFSPIIREIDFMIFIFKVV
jgi:hypothetical protein